MPEYCSDTEVKRRATVNGWRWIADRDRDGIVNTTEQAEVDYCIAWAGRRIDVAIAPQIQPSEARAQGNDYLGDIAIDLAVYRLFTNGGDDPPVSIEKAFDAAVDALTAIKGGEQIPGLTFNPPYPSVVSGKLPRAYMPR